MTPMGASVWSDMRGWAARYASCNEPVTRLAAGGAQPSYPLLRMRQVRRGDFANPASADSVHNSAASPQVLGFTAK
jgi:hypothetical protein